jgi:hypothetical protein
MSLREIIISAGVNFAVAAIILYFTGPHLALIWLCLGFVLILGGWLTTSGGVPSIVPVRYDSGQSSARQNEVGQWCNADGKIMSTADVLRARHWVNLYGLVVRNYGDPAFEIKPIGNVPVGKSTLVFGGDLPNWTRDDGEGFLPINMERKEGGSLLGGLFDEMKDQDIVIVPITIRYVNSKGHRYKTTCKVERDVRAPHGLSVIKVRHGRDLLGFLRRD